MILGRSFTRRIFTRSPTLNAQAISQFALPESTSTSFQIMLQASDARLISGMRSSHSNPSATWCGCAASPDGVAVIPSEATSFIPHDGHDPGSALTTVGCMGQVQAVTSVGAAP